MCMLCYVNKHLHTHEVTHFIYVNTTLVTPLSLPLRYIHTCSWVYMGGHETRGHDKYIMCTCVCGSMFMYACIMLHHTYVNVTHLFCSGTPLWVSLVARAPGTFGTRNAPHCWVWQLPASLSFARRCVHDSPSKTTYLYRMVSVCEGSEGTP